MVRKLSGINLYNTKNYKISNLSNLSNLIYYEEKLIRECKINGWLDEKDEKDEKMVKQKNGQQ